MREYNVRLVLSDGYFVDGLFVFRGESLPEENQVITVESKRVPPERARRARVARVMEHDDGLLIHATELR